MEVKNPKFEIGEQVKVLIMQETFQTQVTGAAYILQDAKWVYRCYGLNGAYEESLLTRFELPRI